MSEFEDWRPTERHEVYIPADHNAQDKLAFLAMIKSFGWEHRDLTPDSRLVTTALMLNTAEQMYGCADAGILAAIAIDTLCDAAHGSVYDTLTSKHSWKRRTPYSAEFAFGLNYISSIGLNDATDELSVSRAITDALADTHEGRFLKVTLPFELQVSRASSNPVVNDNGVQLFHVEPGPVTRQGIATYVEQRGWLDHVPHGILGRMARMLAEIAEAELPQAAETEPSEYITVKDLISIARVEGLGPGTIKGIVEKINRSYLNGIHGFASFRNNNVYDDFPKLTFEGIGTASLESRNSIKVGAELVAVESVPILARHYLGLSDAIDFLKNFSLPTAGMVDLASYDKPS